MTAQEFFNTKEWHHLHVYNMDVEFAAFAEAYAKQEVEELQ